MFFYLYVSQSGFVSDDCLDKRGFTNLLNFSRHFRRNEPNRLERQGRVGHGVVEPYFRHDGSSLDASIGQEVAILTQRLGRTTRNPQQHWVADLARWCDSQQLRRPAGFGLGVLRCRTRTDRILRAQSTLGRLLVSRIRCG